MTATYTHDILFDDSIILKQVIEQRQLLRSISNSDCDCTSYISPADHEDINPDKGTQSIGKAD